MSQVGLGVVGTGIFATDAHLPALETINGLKVAAAYNRSRAKAENFAQVAKLDQSKVHDSLNELLKDPSVDAIDALLPVQFNLETIKKSFAAGKPVAIEKPISSNLEDAKKIVQLSRTSDLPLLILENVAYTKVVSQIKALLPKIGKPVTFLFQSTGPYTPSKYHATGWRQKPEHVGGYLSDGGVHQIALITGILGPVESVSGRTTQLREVSGDVDTLNSLFNMKDGTFGTFTYGSYFGATKKESKFTILGTKGSIVYTSSPGEEPSILLQQGDNGADALEPQTLAVESEAHGGIDSEFENFLEAVRNKDKKLLAYTPEDGFHHFAVIVAAVHSAQNGGQLTKVETV